MSDMSTSTPVINTADAAPSSPKPFHTASERHEIVQKLYVPLNPWETRILILHPGDFHDPLITSLSLGVFAFAEGIGLSSEHRIIEYEALSYTWGGEIFSHPILCDGHTIGITQNLFRALRYLRLPREESEDRYLWIDALCINQTDNEEKAQQIGLLLTIFKRAKSVVAWLGEASTCVVAAIETLRLDLPPVTRSKWEFQNRLDQFRYNPGAAQSPEFWLLCKGVHELLQRSWFRRAWVVQEVFASKSLVVLCGRHTIHWNALCYLVEQLESIAQLTYNNVRGVDAALEKCNGYGKLEIKALVANIAVSTPAAFLRSVSLYDSNMSRRFATDQSALGFYELLLETSHLEATDDRDRIWALVALTSLDVYHGTGKTRIPSKSTIRIDYGMSKAQVFSEVTQLLLQGLFPTLPSLNQYNPNLPSWCIDFSSAKLPTLQRKTSSYDRPETVKERLENDFVLPSISKQPEDWHTLHIPGWHIATVTRVSDSDSSWTFVWVTLTDILKRWIKAQVASYPEWQHLHPELSEYFPRNNSKPNIRGRINAVIRRNKDSSPQYIPADLIERYIAGQDMWQARGSVRDGDIITHASFGGETLVLRPGTDSDYSYIGNAIPQMPMWVTLISGRNPGGWGYENYMYYPTPSDLLKPAALEFKSLEETFIIR